MAPIDAQMITDQILNVSIMSYQIIEEFLFMLQIPQLG
jgi:hypothetical protein